jgi:hypothetical protein
MIVHPQDFLCEMLAKGRKDLVISMVEKSLVRLHSQLNDHNSRESHRFSILFLVSVLRQLNQLCPDAPLESDNLLLVWRDLGLFGIDRSDLAEMFNE